jgi:hypothetical protein
MNLKRPPKGGLFLWASDGHQADDEPLGNGSIVKAEDRPISICARIDWMVFA